MSGYEKKILIIDNFNTIPYKDERRSKILSYLSKMFSKIILLSDNLLDMQIISSQIDNISNIDIGIYQILYWGNAKRKEFVEKWYCLGDEYAINSPELEERVTKTCQKIDELLGRYGGLLPATPIYLINILQNIDSASPASFSGSQYGFLYESLINKNLSVISKEYKDAGAINIDINILSLLAFKMLINNTNTFTADNLQEITRVFSEDKIVDADGKDILRKMLSSKIIAEVATNTYKFRYPYIFYYFSGRYIAYHSTDQEVKKQLEFMSKRLYNEKYGNIIIFVCHFANNTEIIENILLVSYSTLENYAPFEFDKHTDVFNRANEIIEQVLIPPSVGTDNDVKEYKEKELIEKDNAGIQDGTIKETQEISDEDAEREKELSDMTAAMRIIDVLGQIIRNYPGDINGDLKTDIINEIHLLGMRFIEAMLSTMEVIEKDFISIIVDKVKEKDEKIPQGEIIVRVQAILSSIIAEMVRGMISKIAFSMSNESLLRAINETFSHSELVSQQLILEDLRFNVLKKPDITELFKLYDKLGRNANTKFAATILKAIVATYLRRNECGYQLRNQLCSKFHLSSDKYLIESIKHNKDK